MSLTETDWSAEWRRLQRRRGRRDDPARWDARARTFPAASDASGYAATFIDYMGIRAGESVLDVGSGSGALALPLARAGHDVCAVDFSREMLAVLERRAEQELRAAEKSRADRRPFGAVTTVRASWEDDWDAAGIPPADVAVASRSISVVDLGAVLRKLHAHARRRACLTVAAGVYPGAWLAHRAVGRPADERHDFIYCLAILYQMGVRPEVRFIDHGGQRAFTSREEAVGSLTAMVTPEDEREERLLDDYLERHLLSAPGESDERVWSLDEGTSTKWAFMAWDKEAASP